MTTSSDFQKKLETIPLPPGYTLVGDVFHNAQGVPVLRGVPANLPLSGDEPSEAEANWKPWGYPAKRFPHLFPEGWKKAGRAVVDKYYDVDVVGQDQYPLSHLANYSKSIHYLQLSPEERLAVCYRHLSLGDGLGEDYSEADVLALFEKIKLAWNSK